MMLKKSTRFGKRSNLFCIRIY